MKKPYIKPDTELGCLLQTDDQFLLPASWGTSTDESFVRSSPIDIWGDGTSDDSAFDDE